MSCAACSSRVEKAVSKVPGVESCSVSLLTNSMGVEGTASPEAVIATGLPAKDAAQVHRVAQVTVLPEAALKRICWKIRKRRY